MSDKKYRRLSISNTQYTYHHNIIFYVHMLRIISIDEGIEKSLDWVHLILKYILYLFVVEKLKTIETWFMKWIDQNNKLYDNQFLIHVLIIYITFLIFLRQWAQENNIQSFEIFWIIIIVCYSVSFIELERNVSKKKRCAHIFSRERNSHLISLYWKNDMIGLIWF